MRPGGGGTPMEKRTFPFTFRTEILILRRNLNSPLLFNGDGLYGTGQRSRRTIPQPKFIFFSSTVHHRYHRRFQSNINKIGLLPMFNFHIDTPTLDPPSIKSSLDFTGGLLSFLEKFCSYLCRRIYLRHLSTVLYPRECNLPLSGLRLQIIRLFTASWYPLV